MSKYVKQDEFKELPADEVAEFEMSDQIKYFNDLNQYRAKKLEDLKETLKKENSNEIKKQIDELKNEINSATRDQLDALNKSLEAQGDAIRKLLEKGTKNDVQTLKSLIAKEFPNIQKKIHDDGGRHAFRVKVGNLVNKTTIGLSSITDDPFGMMLPGFAEVQSQRNAIAPSLTPFTLTEDDHGVIYWVDMTTRTSNAAARSDGSAAGEQVYAWTGYSETVDNISAMVPVHKEALKHVSVLQNEIQRLLKDDVAVALDDYCYTGTGTAPQIGGVYTRATAFNPTTFIAAGGKAVAKANIYDLIMSMSAQIMKGTKYIVDRVWINPYDALSMKLTKNDNGVYTVPPFAVMTPQGKVEINNMQIIEANSVTVNTLVVGDSTKATLYSTGEAEIEIGYNLTGDFGKRILTILANIEASLVIRNAEVDAFLKSTSISSDVSDLTAGA